MKKTISILIAAVMLAVTPVAVLADNHEKTAKLDDVWLLVPKKGMSAQFFEAAEAHMKWRAEQDESRTWNAYTVVIGDNPNLVMFRAGNFDWPDMDAYVKEDLAKGLGQHWNDNVDAYVDHYHHYFERMDFENSYWPDDETDFQYYGVTTWVWKEDAGRESSEARKAISKLALEHGWGESGNTWLWHSRIGGRPELKIVTGFKDFADMAPPEQTFFEFLTEHLGSADAASELFEEFGSGFQSSDYTVWAHNPSLSTP